MNTTKTAENKHPGRPKKYPGQGRIHLTISVAPEDRELMGKLAKANKTTISDLLIGYTRRDFELREAEKARKKAERERKAAEKQKQ